MKRTNIWKYGMVCITAMLPTFSDASVLNGLWGKTVTRNGVTLMRYEEQKDGSYWGALKEDTMIQGFPCKGGWFPTTWFSKDDILSRFLAFKPVFQDDIEFPAKTRITLYPSGRIRRVSLREDMRIHGFLCKKNSVNRSCGFREDGSVFQFMPAEMTEIDGILLSPNHEIYLHPNGRLKSGALAKDTEIDGQLLKKGARVELDEVGHLVSDETATDAVGGDKIAIIRIDASLEQDENVAANAADGDLNTRWSAEGEDQWIRFELEESVQVRELGIAWYRGSRRQSAYQVQVSEDGVRWETTITKRSSGKSDEIEKVNIPDRVTKWIRIVVLGNDVNRWNSISEVEFYGVGSVEPKSSAPTP